MYQRMKMLLGGLILSTGLIVTTPVSYAAETQVNGEEDIELAYENVDVCTCNLSITGKEATCKSFVRTRSSKSQAIKVVMKLQKKLCSSVKWKACTLCQEASIWLLWYMETAFRILPCLWQKDFLHWIRFFPQQLILS